MQSGAILLGVRAPVFAQSLTPQSNGYTGIGGQGDFLEPRVRNIKYRLRALLRF